MDNYAQMLISIDKGELNTNQKVQLIELLINGLTIGTIQEVADITGKSYNGVKTSGRFKKIKIGSKILAVDGVRNDSLPF